MTVPDIQVRAAGGLLRRQTDTGAEFCLVHRPKYLDWTIPKGKLDPGESHVEAAVREVEEETGFSGDRGPELPGAFYEDAEGRRKEVRYWLMTPTDGAFRPNDEVDELRWVSPAEAVSLLTYAHDRAVVTAALGFDAPAFLIRHAKAGSRSEWSEDDRVRPLSKKGRAQAEGIARGLATLEVTRIISSPYVRCVQTVRPLALASGIPIEERDELAEGARIAASWELLQGLSGSAALCSHGDVIPALIRRAEKDGARMMSPLEFSKGSVWRLERVAGRVVGGTQLLP
jgi:8-oxo-dGTP pyrophosphatase MutT (NUDIX family)/phosphohistidine phosphatase SixA